MSNTPGKRVFDTDIAVVGASSAGLYAATLLARAGRRVVVWEQEPQPAPARRILIVTRQLEGFLGPLPGWLVLNRIRVMAMASRAARIAIPLDPSDLVVERADLVRFLTQQALAVGVEIHYGHRFQGFMAEAGRTMLCFQAEDGSVVYINAGAAIGADGAFSAVGKAAGIKGPPVVPLLQAEVRLPPGWDPAVTQVWFETGETRFFYWLIPATAERGVVGLIGSNRLELPVLLRRFLERLGLQAIGYQGGWAALHHPGLRPWGWVGSLPVFLVGDAAGQVKVTTVGGTVTGLWGARAVARALLQGTEYGRELRPLKRELDLHWALRLLMDRLDNAGYDDLVQGMTPAVQAFLGRHSRDEVATAFWRLPFLQPKLALLGLRLLLRRPERHPPAEEQKGVVTWNVDGADARRFTQEGAGRQGSSGRDR